MNISITLSSQDESPDALQRILASELSQTEDVRFELRRFRGVETAVLVAVVGTLGTGLGALITGILKVVAQKGAGKIILHGRSGRQVEVPTNTAPEALQEYVRIAKELDVERIEL